MSIRISVTLINTLTMALGRPNDITVNWYKPQPVVKAVVSLSCGCISNYQDPLFKSNVANHVFKSEKILDVSMLDIRSLNLNSSRYHVSNNMPLSPTSNRSFDISNLSN